MMILEFQGIGLSYHTPVDFWKIVQALKGAKNATLALTCLTESGTKVKNFKSNGHDFGKKNIFRF